MKGILLMKMNYESIKRMEEFKKIILSLAAIATVLAIPTITLMMGIVPELTKYILILTVITDVTVFIRVLIFNRQISNIRVKQ